MFTPNGAEAAGAGVVVAGTAWVAAVAAFPVAAAVSPGREVMASRQGEMSAVVSVVPAEASVAA